jgi:hypothetical protein
MHQSQFIFDEQLLRNILVILSDLLPFQRRDLLHRQSDMPDRAHYRPLRGRETLNCAEAHFYNVLLHAKKLVPFISFVAEGQSAGW